MRRRCSGVVLLVTLLTGCSDNVAYEKPPIPVQIATPRRQPIGESLRYSATVEPATRVELAFRVGGYVTDLARTQSRVVQDGDQVRAGATLAVLRTSDYEQKVQQARAQLAEAQATRGAATKAVERAEALFASRSLTRPELDQARATLESVEARIAGANGLIREAELARGDTTLRAPISGVIVERRVEIGSLVSPGTPAFILADTSRVKVVLQTPDTMLARLRPGTTALVGVEALPDRRFEGRVTRVSPTAGVRTRMFEVELTVANEDGTLKPGMVARVTVADPATPQPDALVVPLSAIVRPPGKIDRYAVFIVEDRDAIRTARLREVTLGALTGNDVIVLEGLTGNEQVIIRGASMVSDGERVNPTR
jgi:RND family efflux transporter MFP subunit